MIRYWKQKRIPKVTMKALWRTDQIVLFGLHNSEARARDSLLAATSTPDNTSESSTENWSLHACRTFEHDATRDATRATKHK